MKTLRVIIFEDNRSLREGLFQLINGTPGFECAGAFANCTDLVKDIHQTNPDVILMDIMMPVMDGNLADFKSIFINIFEGFTSTKKIRSEIPAEDQPKIVALTARAFTEDRIECLNCGMDDVITKPINPAIKIDLNWLKSISVVYPIKAITAKIAAAAVKQIAIDEPA